MQYIVDTPEGQTYVTSDKAEAIEYAQQFMVAIVYATIDDSFIDITARYDHLPVVWNSLTYGARHEVEILPGNFQAGRLAK